MTKHRVLASLHGRGIGCNEDATITRDEITGAYSVYDADGSCNGGLGYSFLHTDNDGHKWLCHDSKGIAKVYQV